MYIKGQPYLWQLTFYQVSHYKTSDIENLLAELTANDTINNQKHLFNMAPFIFNDRLQSTLESFTGSKQYFLRDQSPFSQQLQFQIIQRIMWSSANLTLQNWPHSKVKMVQIRAPWGSFIFANESLNGTWIQLWVILEPCDGSESCWRVHGAPSKCLCAQGSSSASKMSKMQRWLFNMGVQKWVEISQCCDCRPHHQRKWNLASAYSPAFHWSISTPNSIILVV